MGHNGDSQTTDGLDRLLLKPGSTEYYIADFQANELTRRRYRLVLADGQSLCGIPKTTARVGDPDPSLLLQAADQWLSIKFAELVSAKVIPERDDYYFMRIAIEESRLSVAEAGGDGSKPSPYVGAVFVQDGTMLAKACRGQQRDGVHAEHSLLDDKLGERVLAGGVLYTTLEPCTKRGLSELPCVDRIIARKIRRVVIGMLDPNHDIRGEGIWQLREAGIEVAFCGSDQMAQIEDISRKFVLHYRKPRR
ncbi:MAG: hypothetical protein ABSF35_14920 [Polyangia bacterium]